MKKTLLVLAACTLTLAIGASAWAVSPGDSWITEVRDAGGALNPAWVQNGTWANSSGKSTAPGLVGFGSLYGSTYRSIVGLKEITAHMDIPAVGLYEVFVTWGANANRRANIGHTVHSALGDTLNLVDQSATANAWVSLGTYCFQPGTGLPVVTVSNSTVDLSGSMYADAVKITYACIPEPGSLLALGTGMIGLFGFIRRRK